MHAVIFCLFFLGITTVLHADEEIPGVVSHYRVVEVSDGSHVQSIITQPRGDTSRRHPLLFTQWVSCGSLAYREGSNARELLASLARDSGLSLVRVERPALNDTGPSCAELDYDTEVQHYIEAFAELLDDDLIDASRVYVYGSSLGSTTAPLVALELQNRGFDIAGIMVQGGGAVTYFERMLNFDRYYLERRPDDVSPADIHDEIRLRTKFQYEYLFGGRHPDEIAKDSSDMARIRNDILGMGDTEQYGRPFAWHQQAARHNFLAAWAQLEAPVLVIFNAYDQFESRHGHQLIAETVNRLRPGTAIYVERPCIGHSDNRYASIEDAYAFNDGTPAWREAAQIMTSWLRDQD